MNEKDWIDQFQRLNGRQPNQADYQQSLLKGEVALEKNSRFDNAFTNAPAKQSSTFGAKIGLMVAGILLILSVLGFGGWRFYKYGSLTSVTLEKSKANIELAMESHWKASEAYFLSAGPLEVEQFDFYGGYVVSDQSLLSRFDELNRDFTDNVYYSFDDFYHGEGAVSYKTESDVRKEIKEESGYSDVTGVLLISDPAIPDLYGQDVQSLGIFLINNGSMAYVTSLDEDTALTPYRVVAERLDGSSALEKVNESITFKEKQFEIKNGVFWAENEEKTLKYGMQLLNLEEYNKLVSQSNGLFESYSEEYIRDGFKALTKETLPETVEIAMVSVYPIALILDEANDCFYSLVLDTDRLESLYYAEDLVFNRDYQVTKYDLKSGEVMPLP